MKIIQVLILMLLCLDFQSVNANSTYDWGDTLHVWATSGLNMREGPGTDFPKMKKLEYGDKVQVIDDYLRSTPLSLTVIKKSKKNAAFVMKGHWVRVIIGSQEGYVFDGYLSRLPVMKIKKNNNDGFWAESFNDYAKREFGVIHFEKDSNRIKEMHTHVKYGNGFEWKEFGEKCYDMNLELNSLSFNEAYLLFNRMGSFETNLKKVDENEIEYFDITVKNEKKGFYTFQFSNGGWGIYLVWENGKFIIKEEACC